MKSARKTIDSEKLRSRIKLRHQMSERSLRENHPTAQKFFDAHQTRPGKLRRHAATLLASGALAGGLLVFPASHTNNIQTTHSQNSVVNSASLNTPEEKQRMLSEVLKMTLPPVGDWKLNEDQEKKISQAIEKAFGIKAVAELDGNRLNNVYGRMGAEQHLPRYPGDSLYDHEELQDKGITPGLGAWGYFAYSKDQMTEELYENEKYYVAVQTLYLPDWNTKQPYLKDWYKFRKVVVTNPANGKTIIADVADSGPSNWTGKHFGGSPELMKYLEINYGMQNHPVVLMFLDDNNNSIPVGPVEYDKKKNDLALVNLA